ncbi:hypothetical protein CDEST_12143 [Colletotrichum destructivum]|uniref:Uncharacterized protein n=1 Tax=Colletotrichum destructivum TaxID=34406 RepID=A0AAX4IV13_9PEZI|nr:hypothetical protein CDEST_12143 [Colletotrichum destructivum]
MLRVARNPGRVIMCSVHAGRRRKVSPATEKTCQSRTLGVKTGWPRPATRANSADDTIGTVKKQDCSKDKYRNVDSSLNVTTLPSSEQE